MTVFVGRGPVGEIPQFVTDPKALGAQLASIEAIVNAEQFGRVLPDSVFDRLQQQQGQIKDIAIHYDLTQWSEFRAGYVSVTEIISATSSPQIAFHPPWRNLSQSESI